MMMLHFSMNSGVTNSDGSESYMFGNYSERDVDGGFYYRNPDGRDGVFTNPGLMATLDLLVILMVHVHMVPVSQQQ